MSYDPYSWICIPIHYAPVELKIGTQRGATESRAACGTSKEGGSRNDKSKASCLACVPLSLSLLSASSLLFREPYANRARLNGERCNGPGKERNIRISEKFSAIFFPPRGYRFECANSLGEGRMHRCTKLRTNKSLWHDVRKHSCVNATTLNNSIYITVVLLSTHVVLLLEFVKEYLAMIRVLLPRFSSTYFSKVRIHVTFSINYKDSRKENLIFRNNNN